MAEHAEQTAGPFGIEAEVTEADPRAIQVKAVERWEVWFVQPSGRQWQRFDTCYGAGRASVIADGLKAKRPGTHVCLVHYTLPALTIQAKEN